MSESSRTESDRREARLEVRGDRAVSLDRAALAALPGQVADVGLLVSGKKGRGVRLSALANDLSARALHVHIRSSGKAPSGADFAVSVPIGEVRDAIVVYELDGAPLPDALGGPFRLLVPQHPDECVNVKQLSSLAFADAPGPDTRPKNDAEHALLHARKKSH